MRLGGYFGLTSPMFLLYSTKLSEESFKYGLSILDYPINNDFLKSFKIELYFLYKTINKIIPEYKVGGSITPFTDLNTHYALQNGIITEDNENSDITNLLLDEIAYNIVLRIIKGLSNSESKYALSFLDLENANKTVKNLYDLIEEFLKSLNEPFVNAKRLIMDFSKTLKAEYELINVTKEQICNHLYKAFGFTADLPKEFKVDDTKIFLTDDEYTILQKIYESKNEIIELFDKISLTQKSEEEVFDMAFSNLVNRQPTSIFYLISRRFEYTKNKNSSFLQNIIAETKSEAEHFKKIFKENVSTTLLNDELLSIEEVYKIIDSYDRDKKSFFLDLIKNHYLDPNDLILSDISLLADLFDLISKMNLKDFNNEFHVSFTVESFNEMIYKFNKIGICGLNLQSLNLFRENIKCISLLPSDKIVKSEETYNEFIRVIEDVDCLLDTLIPIGVKINV